MKRREALAPRRDFFGEALRCTTQQNRVDSGEVEEDVEYEIEEIEYLSSEEEDDHGHHRRT